MIKTDFIKLMESLDKIPLREWADSPSPDDDDYVDYRDVMSEEKAIDDYIYLNNTIFAEEDGFDELCNVLKTDSTVDPKSIDAPNISNNVIDLAFNFSDEFYSKYGIAKGNLSQAEQWLYDLVNDTLDTVYDFKNIKIEMLEFGEDSYIEPNDKFKNIFYANIYFDPLKYASRDSLEDAWKEGDLAEYYDEYYASLQADYEYEVYKDSLNSMDNMDESLREEKQSLHESQAQEIGEFYQELSSKFGIDFEDLVYGPEGFMKTQYPNGFEDFSGDVIFSENHWAELVTWAAEKGIDLTNPKADNSDNEAI